MPLNTCRVASQPASEVAPGRPIFPLIGCKEIGCNRPPPTSYVTTVAVARTAGGDGQVAVARRQRDTGHWHLALTLAYRLFTGLQKYNKWVVIPGRHPVFRSFPTDPPPGGFAGRVARPPATVTMATATAMAMGMTSGGQLARRLRADDRPSVRSSVADSRGIRSWHLLVASGRGISSCHRAIVPSCCRRATQPSTMPS